MGRHPRRFRSRRRSDAKRTQVMWRFERAGTRMASRTDPDQPSIRVETIQTGNVVRIKLIGEADIANLDTLQAALAAVQPDGAEAVQLQLSGLAFADIAALRALASFAADLKTTGRNVTTRGATSVVEKAVRILDVDDELGLS